MSKKWILWAAVPLLLLASPWPAWLWWRQRGVGIRDWTVPLVEPATRSATVQKPLERDEASRVVQEGAFADIPASLGNEDEVFVAGLLAGSGLPAKIARSCSWANAEQHRRLVEDWVHALSLLREQHRLAKEAGGMEFAFIGAPGDLLFSLMPDLGQEIDAGRARLCVPQAPALDAGFGTATARFRLDPTSKTLVVEVRTRYGYFDLELGQDCGEPVLQEALWKASGLLWGALGR